MRINNVKFKLKQQNKLQDSCSVSSGYEHSLKKMQWQIYKAKLEGKAACVHKLQERLCQSFCAKFLATEYAIITLQLNGGKLPSSRVFKSCLRWRAHKCFSVPWASYASNRTPQKEIQYSSIQAPFCAEVCSRKKEESTSTQRACLKYNQYTQRQRQKAATQVSEGWKIFIAQSLWGGESENNSNERGVLLNGGTGAQKECLKPLERSFMKRIQEEARQIHAIFALEPEWQALFSCSKRWNNGCVVPSTKSKSVQQEVDEYEVEFYERSRLPSTKQLLKSIKTDLHTRSPQFVLMGSVEKYLYTVNHQIVIDILKTFKAMEKRIRFWLKKICVSGKTSSKATYTPPPLRRSHHGKKEMHVIEGEYLCSLARTHSFINMSVDNDDPLWKSFRAQRVCAWPATQFFLYSCFPRVLWKEQPIMHDVTQIEDYTNCKQDIIARFLSRVLLYDLVEKVQEFAQSFFRSKYENICARDTTLLQSVTGRPAKKENCRGVRQRAVQVDPLIEEKSRDLPRKEERNACALKGSKQFFDSKSVFLCTGGRNSFIIIHPNKRFLEECAEKVQDYLEKILSHNQSTLPDLKPSTERVFRSYANHATSRKAIESTSFSQKNDNAFLKKKSISNIQKDVLQIKDCRQGFSLLGFQITQIGDDHSYTCKVIPCKKSVEIMALLIKSKVKQSRTASTTVWINRLNMLLSHWIEYYNEHEYVHSYHKLSSLVWGNLRSLLSHRKAKRR